MAWQACGSGFRPGLVNVHDNNPGSTLRQGLGDGLTDPAALKQCLDLYFCFSIFTGLTFRYRLPCCYRQSFFFLFNITQTVPSLALFSILIPLLAVPLGSWRSFDHYLELLGRTITNVHRRPGRLRQSIEESSFDAWTKLYKQDANSPNAMISYYSKGSLVALALLWQILAAVLDDPEVNWIVITTNHDSHARLCCQALRAGKHVFVEKPLALDLIDQVGPDFQLGQHDQIW